MGRTESVVAGVDPIPVLTKISKRLGRDADDLVQELVAAG